MPYRIEFSPEARQHLRALAARERALIVAAVRRQLRHEPTTETRNRKPMRPNRLALWELRAGDFRVYFDVDEEPEPLVSIRAIGIKTRDKVSIGGEEVDL